MEERLKKYSNKDEADLEGMRSRIREAWRKKDTANRKTSQKSMIIYLIAVILLIYFLFFR